MKTTPAAMLALWTALGACAASDEAPAPSSRSEPALVGSYPTRNGGRLEIFEPVTGAFLIGELSDADDGPLALAAQPNAAASAAPHTLGALYQRLVGGPVPAELRDADARLALGSAADAVARPLAPSFVSEEAGTVESAGTIEKEVDRDVETFRGAFCRLTNRIANTGGCQSFNYCRTETTNDKTFREDGLFGAYSVVRPYRGNVVMEVLYDDELSFSRTVDEGKKYRAWNWSTQVVKGDKVTPGNAPFKLETRVRAAEGDGFHMAVLGTRERRYWNAYDSAAESSDTIGCSLGMPDANAPRGGGLIGIPTNW